ncbi:MAG TPA: vitamin K epoxide reductase family protein [Armatimonadota bacterium]|mgnify:FL=1|nr:vitamin K epoxide reductase family protein [Armatimonadota bacterium]HOP80604.1 vitamin K epoxide reductase family protein [Armatimonadota bacterium]HPP74481.1 vitamin K epoxide reductase family protein [Armatimonadota bacterium]
MSIRNKWSWVAGLATAGVIDSLYLLLFQTKKIDRIICPIFGEGCERVSRHPIAYPRGIPDAIFGVAGYTAAAAIALAIPRTTGNTQKTLAAAAAGGSVLAAGLSAFLTYAQPTKTGAWCFWCLVSAIISTTMAPIAISGSIEILRNSNKQE